MWDAIRDRTLEVAIEPDSVVMELTGHDEPAYRAIDLGDAEFARRYVVDGVPQEHIRALLDDEHRRMILALGPYSISIRDGRLALILPWHYWGPEPADRVAGERLLVSLEQRHAMLWADRENEVLAAAPSTAPFRGAPDRAALVQLERADALEARSYAALKLRANLRASLGAALAVALGGAIAIVLSWLGFL
jgi:hypothetical protein